MSCLNNGSFVWIALDEMKVKENFVHTKYTGEVVGFTNLGNINGNLQTWEISMATLL